MTDSRLLEAEQTIREQAEKIKLLKDVTIYDLQCEVANGRIAMETVKQQADLLKSYQADHDERLQQIQQQAKEIDRLKAALQKIADRADEPCSGYAEEALK